MTYRATARWLLALALVASVLIPGSYLGSDMYETAIAQGTADEEIIYIDGAGFIRVIDPNVATGTQAIQWSSPEGGWFDFATGDFNNDGDAEIAAIGNNKLTVFDPVVRDETITPDGDFSNVPWKRLYEQAIPGTSATLIDAGNLDAGVAGDEIIFGFNVSEPNNINYRLNVLKTPDGGRNWLIHLNNGFGGAWKTLDVGNVNNAGSEDVALTRDAGQLYEAREIDNNFNGIFTRSDVGLFTPIDAEVGQFYPGGTGEVALLRTFNGTTEAPVLLIYQFRNGQWDSTFDNGAINDELRYFPHPTALFSADINNNGDDELFAIRAAASSATFARIFMINRGGDNLPTFESPLDSDGGYTVGAGGDVDGDGEDEVIIMRNNRIRNYYDPKSGNANLFTDYSNISTNSRSLAVANLDGNGFVPGARLVVDQDSITIDGTAGLPSQNVVRQIRISNGGSGGNIPFSVRKEGGASWFTLTSDSVSQADRIGNIYLSQFDASSLEPGTYTERLIVTSSNTTVTNQPLYINVTFNVQVAPFALSESDLTLAHNQGQVMTPTTTVNVSGLPGLTFTAALLSKPSYDRASESLGQTPVKGRLTEAGEVFLSDMDGNEVQVERVAVQGRAAAAQSWPSAFNRISVSSAGDTVPDTIVLTLTPSGNQPEAYSGILVVIADDRAGAAPGNISTLDVMGIQNGLPIYLSLIAN